MRLMTALLFVGLASLCGLVAPSGAQPEMQGFATHVSLDHGKEPGTFRIQASVVELGTGKIISKASLNLVPGRLSEAESVDPASGTTVRLDAKVGNPAKSAEYNLSVSRSNRMVAKHSGAVVIR